MNGSFSTCNLYHEHQQHCQWLRAVGRSSKKLSRKVSVLDGGGNWKHDFLHFAFCILAILTFKRIVFLSNNYFSRRQKNCKARYTLHFAPHRAAWPKIKVQDKARRTYQEFFFLTRQIDQACASIRAPAQIDRLYTAQSTPGPVYAANAPAHTVQSGKFCDRNSTMIFFIHINQLKWSI